MNPIYNKKHNRISLYFLIGLLCLSFHSLQASRKPKWVKQRPTDNAYYFGIGTTLKTESEIDYKTIARNKALKELSSEIKVNISSNSVLHQLEDNYELQEHFEAKTSESVEATLEGYEVYTWENKQEYWIMLKLSKEKYALRQQIKLDYAKKLSSSYFYDGKKAVEKGNIYRGLLFYIQALEAITPHIQEDLEYKDVDGSINLGTDIFIEMNNALKKINLEADQSNYMVQFSQELKIPIAVHAFYYNSNNDKIPIANLPIRFSFTKGEGDLNPEETTNNRGQATCDINRLVSKRKTQEITAAFDIDKLTEKEDTETKLLAKAFMVSEIVPKAIININIQKSSAYLDMNEIVFGDQSTNYNFDNMVKNDLAQGYFNISNNKETAEFTVKINSNFIAGDQKGGNGYTVYFVYANFYITVINNKSNLEIFTDGFNNLKGIKTGSYEHALKDARNKAIQKVQEDILPKLEQMNF